MLADFGIAALPKGKRLWSIELAILLLSWAVTSTPRTNHPLTPSIPLQSIPSLTISNLADPSSYGEGFTAGNYGVEGIQKGKRERGLRKTVAKELVLIARMAECIKYDYLQRFESY